MVSRTSTKKQHISMRGKQIDMELLKKKNELTPAIGNMRVNARGDELGPGGQIVKKREDIIKEYYEKNPNAVKVDTGIEKPKDNIDSIQEDTAQTTVTKKTSNSKSRQTNKKDQETDQQLDFEWQEDEDGNFVKKDS